MSLFRKSTTAPLPAPAGSGPAISLDKVPAGLVNLTKSAAVSLDKSGLTGQRAAVYLVLDHSGSMRPFYKDGSVQRLTDQALGLSVNLDDDGTVPVGYFATHAEAMLDVRLDNYQGVIDRTHTAVPWGTTNYVAAMRNVIDEHHLSGATSPAFVIFQTDGAPNDRRATEQMLKDASRLPIFWAFVGFGGRVEFLEKLDDLRGRAVDNASFFHAANPSTVTDAQLYDGLTHEYAGWLAAASAAGIVR
ncbi:VWA domain-containing protein [Streptomyces poriferorum]|uniref:VWA domain-containing protein n=1 Tax=Streptomyces poriferorum TaxID=2798799 RepID=A0ABY9IY09_9ACTN|nr:MULTISPECIES: VWA domain-containing protein [unclassified Streptomyces]MDP5310466.1 VWA domain-containing protein [Streptomyces sp. Alt4]WLQ60380.1 VWA domain-containing protein [Streptomyces sp. Alt2]